MTALKQNNDAVISDCLRAFEAKAHLIKTFLEQMTLFVNSSPKLKLCVHSVRARLKRLESLEDKLTRKMAEAKKSGETFDITPDNLLEKINDLAGLRILHINRSQIVDINTGIREVLEEQKLKLLEVFARTWDDKSREFFAEIGIPTEVSPTMYTSVHYVLGSGSKTTVTCEIQVRTLMEEAWGEVDHAINYPHPIDDVACRAQLETLAHTIRGATANIDGIIRSVEALKAKQKLDK